MKVPIPERIRQYPVSNDEFRGIYHNIRCDEGYFYDLKNLTLDDYPTISSLRDKYSTKAWQNNVVGMIAHDDRLIVLTQAEEESSTDQHPVELYEVDKDSNTVTRRAYLAIPGGTVPTGVTGAVMQEYIGSRTDRYIVVMGAYYIVMPDKFAVKTDFSACWISPAVYKYDISGAETLVAIPDGTWTGGPVTVFSSSEPSNPTADTLWADTSVEPYVIRRFSGGGWSLQKSGVDIAVEDESVYEIGSRVCIVDHADPYMNGLHTVVGSSTGHIIIEANRSIGNTPAKQSGRKFQIEVEHIPDFKYCFECNNRMWGCIYDDVDEIVCSELGNFKAYVPDKNIASDAFYATRPHTGEYTGAINHGGVPTFFREHSMTRVHGDEPATFSISEIECKGVRKGASGSLVELEGVLYYESPFGVYCYDGSMPRCISEAIDGMLSADTEDIAGVYKDKYVLVCNDYPHFTAERYIYDRRKGMWTRETSDITTSFTNYKNRLISNWRSEVSGGTWNTTVVEYGDKFRSSDTTLGLQPYECETGYIGLRLSDRYKSRIPEQKYVTRIILRVKAQGTVEVFVSYDDGGWISAGSKTSTDISSKVFPIIPRRCDRMRIKIAGTGVFQLLSYTKTLEVGSDVTW